MSDLIRRNDAIEAVVNAHPMAEVEKGSSKQVFWVRVSDVAKALKALPSADITQTAECQRCQEATERVLNNQGRRIQELEDRQKGEWVKTDKIGLRKCSCCGVKLLVYAQGNFCPNCGADMRGEDHE